MKSHSEHPSRYERQFFIGVFLLGIFFTVGMLAIGYFIGYHNGRTNAFALDKFDNIVKNDSGNTFMYIFCAVVVLIIAIPIIQKLKLQNKYAKRKAPNARGLSH